MERDLIVEDHYRDLGRREEGIGVDKRREWIKREINVKR